MGFKFLNAAVGLSGRYYHEPFEAIADRLDVIVCIHHSPVLFRNFAIFFTFAPGSDLYLAPPSLKHVRLASGGGGDEGIRHDLEQG